MEVYKLNPEYADIIQLINKDSLPKSIYEILHFINSLDRAGLMFLAAELCKYFNFELLSMNYKKNEEIIITAKNKNEKIIISIKLWDSFVGDIVMLDFKDLISSSKAVRGILMIYGGYSGKEHNSGNEHFTITLISKTQFSEILNKIIRMMPNA